MPDRFRAQIIDPLTAMSDGEAGPYPFDLFARRALAQGDSWFSMGAIPPTRTTRVVAELQLLHSTVIVNCAKPGALLHRMTNTTTEPQFLNLLAGRRAMRWDVILLSGGGNDLIEAVGARPSAAASKRLLRTPVERGTGALNGADYISETGWATFAAHIGSVFNRFVDLRDGSKLNKRTPIVWHNYARVQPTAVGAGMTFGPWLLPALQRYAVPEADLLPVSDELIARLGRLVASLVATRLATDPGAALHVADSASAGLVLAARNATDASGDWINEIHPTRDGYRKCAQAWQAVLDPLLG